MIVAAVHKFLQETASVAAKLARYDSGEGMKPAVFTSDVVPAGCGNPAIIIIQDDVADWERTRALDGKEYTLEIRVWGDRDGSNKDLRQLATTVATELRNAKLPLEGWTHVKSSVHGPSQIKSEEGFPGYQVSADFNVRQNP